VNKPDGASPYLPVQAKLLSRREETTDTTTLHFRAPAGYSFMPGQFNMIFVPGVGEVPISLSGNANNRREIVHTVRNVGAVSGAIAQTRVGAFAGLRGPYGTGWPLSEAKGKDLVIVAGGIGLAPLRPVIYDVLSRRNHYRKVTILYGARSPRDVVFRDELGKWVERGDIHVEISLDRGDSAWLGHVGVITRFIPWVEIDPVNTVAMVCGPEVMMRFSVRELQTLGIQDGSIFLSMERNMRCGLGHCGHCQFGGDFVCKEGPVFSYEYAGERLMVQEV